MGRPDLPGHKACPDSHGEHPSSRPPPGGEQQGDKPDHQTEKPCPREGPLDSRQDKTRQEN